MQTLKTELVTMSGILRVAIVCGALAVGGCSRPGAPAKVDPSDPAITAIIDSSGLVIYFLFASVVLGLGG